MGELRITIVVADDPETNLVRISGLGSNMLPAPIEGTSFEECWKTLGERLDAFRAGPEPKGPWG